MIDVFELIIIRDILNHMGSFETYSANINPDRNIVIDIEDAPEFLSSEIERGNFPIISIPIEYSDVAKKGLEPHTSWVGQARIRARLGKPYLPEGQERRCFRIKKNSKSFRPERTGPDNNFHGVVSVLGPIRPNDLEEIPCPMN